jgi:predicted DNA-binding protein YlxM (UPF0122 family)
MVIYKTTNLVNGKIYIGQDSKNNPKYLGSGVILLKAIKKYGKINFKKEIIDEAFSFDELNRKEVFWINEYDSMNQKRGYNVSFGGYGNPLPKEILLRKSEKAKKEGTYRGENNGNFKYDIKDVELIDLYLIKNLKIDEIASKYGCHRQVISNKLKLHNIKKELSNKYNFKTSDLWQYYMIDNLSYAAIAKIYGCSNKTIFKKIKKCGWVNDNTIKFVKESKFGLNYGNLHQEFIVSKLSKSKISKKYNCSVQLLNYTLKKFKLI